MDIRPWKERDKILYQLSQELHYIIFPITFGNDMHPTNWEEINEELYYLIVDCSWYIDNWEQYGKSFIREFGKIRSLARTYKVYVKQMETI